LETFVLVLGEEMFSSKQEGEGGEERNSENVWGELQQQEWTKERDLARLCELQAESGYYPTGPKSACNLIFKF
jgi:hypothetical protein